MCSQGQFSINLIGTGLKVAEATKWMSQGNYVSVKVHRSEVRRKRTNNFNILGLSMRFVFSLGAEIRFIKCCLNYHVVCLVWFTQEECSLTFGNSYSQCKKLPFTHFFPFSFVSVCRTEQESTAAVVVSVGSAFPRLTTAYCFKSTEGHAETKPLNLYWTWSPRNTQLSWFVGPCSHLCGRWRTV